jgi:hypothetical protein
MRVFLACAALGVAGICLGGSPPVEDFPARVASIRKDASVSAEARREFEQGVASWDGNRFLSARNHWVRAQAWMEKETSEDDAARQAIAELVDEANRLSEPQPSLEPAASPSPAGRPHHARSPRSGLEAPKPRIASAKTVMARARAAQKAGQIEKAARLMRIASTLPGGEDAAAQAEALEQTLVSGNGNGW